jgi:hypothetical protein
MSRTVIGHKDGKPIYRDDGPNVGRKTTHDPRFVGGDEGRAHRPDRRLGLPGERVEPWEKGEL